MRRDGIDHPVIVIDHRQPVPFVEGGAGVRDAQADALADQARRQEASQQLQVEDGWTYFIYGWTRVIAEVFHVDIPTSGPGFDEICRIAVEAGKPAKQANK